MASARRERTSSDFPISEIPGIKAGPGRYQCREKDNFGRLEPNARAIDFPRLAAVLDDGIRGFGSATEENAEAAGVEPSPSDATHAAEPPQLWRLGSRHGFSSGLGSTKKMNNRDDRDD